MGDLKANRVVEVSGVKQKVSQWTATLLPWRRTKFTVAGRTQWYYTKSVRLPNVDHLVQGFGSSRGVVVGCEQDY